MKKQLFLLITVLLFVSCGIYSFKGSLPPHIKSIAIPEFEDKTAEFDLGATISEKVRDGFIREKILDLVEMENAHSVLYCTITSIDDQPAVYSETETGEAVDEYRVTIKLDVEWKDLVKDRSIFQQTISGYSEYDPNSASERDDAIAQAIENITDDIIEKILSDW